MATDLPGLSDREQIMQATAELCAREGFEQISVEQVVERAGVGASCSSASSATSRAAPWRWSTPCSARR